MPKISVIMPVFNTGEILKYSIESIIKQTFMDFEFIIVDDFSNDTVTLSVLNEIKDDRVKIYKNITKGSANAYNYGIAKSKSNFISIVDHDDIFACSLFEKEYNFLLAHPSIDIVSTNFIVLDDNGTTIGKVKMPEQDEYIKEKMLYRCSIMNSGSMLRKSVFEKGILFKQEFFPAQDYKLYLDLYSMVNFYNIQEYLIKWRNRRQSPSQMNYNTQKIISKEILIEFINKSKDFLENYNYDLDFLMGRVIYYKEKPQKSIKYFINSLVKGNYSHINLFYLVKAIFLFPFINLYRYYLLSIKYRKSW